MQRLPSGFGLVVGTPKTGRSRRAILLPGVSRAALAEHGARQDAERLVASTWDDRTLVFATARGSILEPRNLNRLFDERIAKAGVRRIRFHDLWPNLRLPVACQGAQPRVVTEVLGHSQLSMTTDLYGHVTPPTGLRAAADAMDGVLRS